MSKTALVTGITGQDGSYLAELLLDKGYNVHGTLRRSSVFTTERIDHIFDHPNLKCHHSDLADSSSLHRLVDRISPDEIYNLGAQSHVGVSFEVPEYTGEVTAIGTARLLDAIKDTGSACRFYQASTSEMFGGLPGTVPQNETTPFHPRSPYGAAKLYAYWLTVNYRESYGLHASNGILFNHESPRRGLTFVTRKITKAVARIKLGKQNHVELGNLDAIRDWGHAKDYVRAMWLMLQLDFPSDLVISTGHGTTVRKFVELAFQAVDINITWRGEGINETGIDSATNRVLVKINSRYFRPAEVDVLVGDCSKARQLLNWAPKTSLEELVSEMIAFDLKSESSSL